MHHIDWTVATLRMASFLKQHDQRTKELLLYEEPHVSPDRMFDATHCCADREVSAYRDRASSCKRTQAFGQVEPFLTEFAA